MLTSYPAIVKSGKIQLQKSVQLPEGTEVLVVIASPEAEKQQAFDEYLALVEQYPSEVDIATVGDQELVSIVHQVREKINQ